MSQTERGVFRKDRFTNEPDIALSNRDSRRSYFVHLGRWIYLENSYPAIQVQSRNWIGNTKEEIISGGDMMYVVSCLPAEIRYVARELIEEGQISLD